MDAEAEAPEIGIGDGVEPRPGAVASGRRLWDDLRAAVGLAVVGADEALRYVHARPARRRPRPRRGRAGHRQDAPRPGGRPGPRPPDGPDPGHARPAADRCDRVEHLRGRRPPVRRRSGLHEHPPGRRDQPGDAADPVGAARGDAGAPGLDRGDDPPAARSVRRPRDPEPGRVRGDVRAAPGPARPVPRPGPGSATRTKPASGGSPGATRPTRSRSSESRPIADAGRLLALRDEVRRVHVSDEVEAYVVALVRATREHDDIQLGASPRATVALYRVAQAAARPRRPRVRPARRRQGRGRRRSSPTGSSSTSTGASAARRPNRRWRRSSNPCRSRPSPGR